MLETGFNFFTHQPIWLLFFFFCYQPFITSTSQIIIFYFTEINQQLAAVHTGCDKAGIANHLCQKVINRTTTVYCQRFFHAASIVDTITDYNGLYSILSLRSRPVLTLCETSVIFWLFVIASMQRKPACPLLRYLSGKLDMLRLGCI